MKPADFRQVAANLAAAVARARDPGRECRERVCDGTGWAYNDAGEAFRCQACAYDEHRAALAEQLAAAGVGARYLNVLWEDLNLLPPLDRLERVKVERVIETGHHAIFTGPPGSGKTQAAILLARDALEQGFTARVANLGAVAMQVRSGYGRDDGLREHEVVTALASVDLLVLDDVGAGEASGGQVEGRLLYQVLEARQNARRATVVTTNLDAKTLSETLGARVTNRLMPAKVYAFTHGRNFRAAPAEENPWP